MTVSAIQPAVQVDPRTLRKKLSEDAGPDGRVTIPTEGEVRTIECTRVNSGVGQFSGEGWMCSGDIESDVAQFRPPSLFFNDIDIKNAQMDTDPEADVVSYEFDEPVQCEIDRTNFQQIKQHRRLVCPRR